MARLSDGVKCATNDNAVNRSSGRGIDNGICSTVPFVNPFPAQEKPTRQYRTSVVHEVVTPLKDPLLTQPHTSYGDISYNRSATSLRSVMQVGGKTEPSRREEVEGLKRELMQARIAIGDYKDELSDLQARLRAAETEKHSTMLELEEVSQQLRTCRHSMIEHQKEYAKQKLLFIELKSQRDDLLEKIQDAWGRIIDLTFEQRKSTTENMSLQKNVSQSYELSDQQTVGLYQRLEDLNTQTLTITNEKEESRESYTHLLHCTGDAVGKLHATLDRLLNHSSEQVRSLHVTAASSFGADATSERGSSSNAGAKLENMWKKSFDVILQSDYAPSKDLRTITTSAKKVVYQLLAPLLRSLRSVGSIWRYFCEERERLLRELKDAHQGEETLSDENLSLRQSHAELLATLTSTHRSTRTNRRSASLIDVLARQLGCEGSWEGVQSRVAWLQQRYQSTETVTPMGRQTLDVGYGRMEIPTHPPQSSSRSVSTPRKNVERVLNRNYSCPDDTLLEGSTGRLEHLVKLKSKRHSDKRPALAIVNGLSTPEEHQYERCVPPTHYFHRASGQTEFVAPQQIISRGSIGVNEGPCESALDSRISIEALKKNLDIRDRLLFLLSSTCSGLILDLAETIQQRRGLCRYLNSLTHTSDTAVRPCLQNRLSARHRRKCPRAFVLGIIAVRRLGKVLEARQGDSSRGLKRGWWRDRLRRVLSYENESLRDGCAVSSATSRTRLEAWSETISEFFSFAQDKVGLMKANEEAIFIINTLLDTRDKSLGLLSFCSRLEQELLPSTLYGNRTFQSLKYALTPYCREPDPKLRQSTRCELYSSHASEDKAGRRTRREVTTPSRFSPNGIVKKECLDGDFVQKSHPSFSPRQAPAQNLSQNIGLGHILGADVDISFLSSLRSSREQRDGGSGQIAEPNIPARLLLGETFSVIHPAPILKPAHDACLANQGKEAEQQRGMGQRSVEESLKLSIERDYLEQAYTGHTALSDSAFLGVGSSVEDVDSAKGRHVSRPHASFPVATFATDLMGMIEALDRSVTGALQRGEGSEKSPRGSL